MSNETRSRRLGADALLLSGREWNNVIPYWARRGPRAPSSKVTNLGTTSREQQPRITGPEGTISSVALVAVTKEAWSIGRSETGPMSDEQADGEVATWCCRARDRELSRIQPRPTRI